jgi:hypothetical protein
MPGSPHPEAERLTAYLLGKLSWSDVEQVENHLGGCAACRSQIDSLGDRADSFVRCLRGSAVEPADDPSLDKLLAGARSLAQGPATESAAAPPLIVAGHELRGELTRGGLGVIYLAWHPHLHDLRVIKRPLPGGDPDLVLARFRREVQAVGALRHDHIVRAHDAGVDNDGPYLVTEYLDGEPLSRLLTRHGPLPVPEACKMIRQAALGLQAAHECGLVHRDIKPSNLMLARAGPGARVVLIDWGLVKRTQAAGPGTTPPDDGLTESGVAMGTLDYMAPEQGLDARTVDIRADIYSLGVTLYCLLAGRPPFQDHSSLDKLVAHNRETFPPLEQVRPDIPPALLAVLARMVAKVPARRYATPAEAAEALRPFCAGAETRLAGLLDGRKPPPLPPRRRRWPGRVTAILVLAALLIGGIALAFHLLHRGPPTPDPAEARATPAVLGEGPAAPVSMAGHPGHCSSLTFMADGRHAVSESGGGGVYVWDLQKRRLDHHWSHSFGKAYEDMSGVVAASPDGRCIAAVGVNTAPRWLLLLSLFDQRTYKRTGVDVVFGRMGPALAFSPDGSMLAAAELPGFFTMPRPGVRIMDATSGNGKSITTGIPIHSLAFAPDGKTLAGGCEDNNVRLWNVGKRLLEREFRGHAGPVDQVAFSIDGKRVYSASSTDGTLRVWDSTPDARPEVRSIPVDGRAKMTCAAFGSGGRALTGHADGSGVVWDLATGEERQRFTDTNAAVTAVAISPDGYHALAARSDRLVYLFRLPSPR